MGAPGVRDVRAATSDDAAAILDTVVAAFVADPLWHHLFGPGDEKARRAFTRTLLEPRLLRGTVWVTPDCTAVAMWDRRIARLHDDLDGADRWQNFRDEVGDEVWGRLESYDLALAAAAPPEPYWYLGVLATHPQWQGQGYASAVMAPALTAADAEGWACWLETSTPGNKPFYARRGFTQPHALDWPEGPTTWWLGRAPVAD